MLDELAGLHFLWGRLPKNERHLPQRIGIQDTCSEAPPAWGPLPPHDPAPLLGEAFFNFHVNCMHQITSTVSQYLVLFSSAPCTALNHLVTYLLIYRPSPLDLMVIRFTEIEASL